MSTSLKFQEFSTRRRLCTMSCVYEPFTRLYAYKILLSVYCIVYILSSRRLPAKYTRKMCAKNIPTTTQCLYIENSLSLLPFYPTFATDHPTSPPTLPYVFHTTGIYIFAHSRRVATILCNAPLQFSSYYLSTLCIFFHLYADRAHFLSVLGRGLVEGVREVKALREK